MTVTLTPEQEKFVTERIRRGGYSSPETVVSEGLKLVEAKEEHQRRLAQLRAEIKIGLDQVERGEVVDGREVIDRLLEKNRHRLRSQ